MFGKPQASPETVLSQDNEIEISTETAYVIGLVAVLSSHNIPWVFRSCLLPFLSNRCIKHKDAAGVESLYVKKKSVELFCQTFDHKYPEYWDAPNEYRKGIEEYIVYRDKFLSAVANLPVKELKIQNIPGEYVRHESLVRLLQPATK